MGQPLQRSILILSGGLDSTVSSWIAREETQPILAITFDYGQRAARREREAAAKTAARLGVDHKVVGLPWLAEITSTALVNPNVALPHLKPAELDETSQTLSSAQAVWVPNRNGIFLNVAAGFAEALGASVLVTGFNAEEGITFPDNSAPFVRAADDFFWYSTLAKVKVVSFTQNLTKREIAKKAVDLGVDRKEIWFCYEGGMSPCRACESCLRAFRAFEANAIPLPATPLPWN